MTTDRTAEIANMHLLTKNPEFVQRCLIRVRRVMAKNNNQLSEAVLASDELKLLTAVIVMETGLPVESTKNLLGFAEAMIAVYEDWKLEQEAKA